MPLPDLDSEGYLPPGIHAAPLAEVLERFGRGSPERERAAALLRLIVEAAGAYTTIKRVLVWGSFATAAEAPNDLDYSIVVGTSHLVSEFEPEHRRFFLPSAARLAYGADVSYVAVHDYPIGLYADRMEFLCHGRDHRERGIVEIHIRGEVGRRK